VRLVLDLKRVLPQPPLPPLATSSVWPSSVRSPSCSPVSTSAPPYRWESEHRHHRRHAGAIVAAAALAVLATVGAGNAKVSQGIHALDRFQIDAPAEAAIAAIGPAEGYGFLAPETHAAAARRCRACTFNLASSTNFIGNLARKPGPSAGEKVPAPYIELALH